LVVGIHRLDRQHLSHSSYPWIAIYGLLAVRFLFGVAKPALFQISRGAQANWFPNTERGFGQGAVWMSGRFGGGVTPFVISLLLITESTGSGEITPLEASLLDFWRHWRRLVHCLLVVVSRSTGGKAHVNAAELALIRKGGAVGSAGHGHVPWESSWLTEPLVFMCDVISADLTVGTSTSPGCPAT